MPEILKEPSKVEAIQKNMDENYDEKERDTTMNNINTQEAKRKLEDAPNSLREFLDVGDYDAAISILLGSPTSISFGFGLGLLGVFPFPKIGITFGFNQYLDRVLGDRGTLKHRSPEELNALLDRISTLVEEYRKKIVTDSGGDKNTNPNEKNIEVGLYTSIGSGVGLAASIAKQEELDEPGVENQISLETNPLNYDIRLGGVSPLGVGAYVSFISEKKILKRLERIQKAVEKIIDKTTTT